jgi:signal transduction histidine kinase
MPQSNQTDPAFCRLPPGYDAGEMIHEISHALAPILMSVEILRRKIADPDVQRHLDLMAGHAWRGAAIVQRFVLLSESRVRGRSRRKGRAAPGATPDSRR